MNCHYDVWMNKSLIERIKKHYLIDPKTNCWIWQRAKSAAGYGQLQDWNLETKKQKTMYAHRVSFTHYTGIEVPDGKDLMHSCDNRACINPDHLSIGTRRDNMADCKNKNRHHHGLKATLAHGKRKLYPFQVAAIRNLRLSGMKNKDIAKNFNISKETISGINTGRSWMNLK